MNINLIKSFDYFFKVCIYVIGHSSVVLQLYFLKNLKIKVVKFDYSLLHKKLLKFTDKELYKELIHLGD